VGLDERGQTIETISISLPAHGRLFKTSAELFGTRNKVELAREIVWAKVQTTQRLVGYVFAQSRDQSQLVCSGGIVSLTPGKAARATLQSRILLWSCPILPDEPINGTPVR